MKPTILSIFLFLAFSANSQNQLPILGNFEWQDACDTTYLSAYYVNDSIFIMRVMSTNTGEYNILKGHMHFDGVMVTLTYTDDLEGDYPNFKPGIEEKYLIRLRGEELIPIGETYYTCTFLMKIEYRV